MDSNLIYERLKALGKGPEQELYRDISQVFEEVIRYNQNALEALQKQLGEELRDVSERYYLYGTVLLANDVPIVNDFLFPMCREPEKNGCLTVFCECSRSDMKELLEGSQNIVVKTKDGCFETFARFRPCSRYQQEVEKLKQFFFENGRFFRTPYLPYLNRFADIECGQLEEAGEIESVHIKDKKTVLRQGLVPVWNVEKIKRQCTIFPVPAVDEQRYRHSLTLPYPKDGYLVHQEPSIHNVFYENQELVLVSDEKDARDFHLYRIAAKREVNVPHYPLTTNMRNMRHIDRQSENAPVRLQTMAEIGRIISSYEAGGNATLCEAKEDGGRLRLKFQVREENFLTADRISFLTGEIQFYYPQFQVEGEIQQ